MPPPREDNPHKNNTLRDFQGVNTQAYRTVIGDSQFAWLENVMPIGYGNMAAIPGASAPLAAWPTPIYYMRAGNLNGVDYEIGFGSDGSMYAINLVTLAVTAVAPAATLQGSGSTLCQWENSQIVVVDPSKGYFTWNGTTLTKWNGTVQGLNITVLGTGYTSQPAAGFSGGGGGGASATVDIQVGLVTSAAVGTGYAVGDILTMVGGTFISAAKVKVSAVNAGTGAITGINLYAAGDYTASPANPAAVTGGYGTGATFTLNFGIGPITIPGIGSGYTSVPAVAITGGGGAGGQVVAALSVVPPSGTGCATYAGRVWVSSGRTVSFSAPTSYNDFTGGSAGGSFIMVDEILHSTISGLLSANNFLYIMGQSSIDVVGDVSVVSGLTVFSRTNLSSNIGSPYPSSMLSFHRGVWLASRHGFYAAYGTTTQKASDDLDGVYNLIDFTKPITGGAVTIFKLLTLCYLFQYLDPVAGSRSLLAVLFNKKWFFASPRSDLTLIDPTTIGGAQLLYGTNGTSLYQLFADATVPLPQTIVTKLWDMGLPIADKRALKLGIEVVNPTNPQVITGTIDTETAGRNFPFSLSSSNIVLWLNNTSATVTWINNLGATVTWSERGYSFAKTDAQSAGKYLGLTVNGGAAGTIYAGLHLQYALGAEW